MRSSVVGVVLLVYDSHVHFHSQNIFNDMLFYLVNLVCTDVSTVATRRTGTRDGFFCVDHHAVCPLRRIIDGKREDREHQSQIVPLHRIDRH